MSRKHYKVTAELNANKSPSTGAVTAFAGKSPWPKAFKEYLFLEISDCHSKVRLHTSQLDSRKDFIAKMKKLRNEIDAFIDHLEKRPKL